MDNTTWYVDEKFQPKILRNRLLALPPPPQLDDEENVVDQQLHSRKITVSYSRLHTFHHHYLGYLAARYKWP